MADRQVVIRVVPNARLSATDLTALRALFSAAWPDGGFTDDDLEHAMGGPHWLAEVDGTIVAHASVDERRLEAGDRPLHTGYLEAVATLPAFERRGIGSRLVVLASDYIRDGFELGGLSTGVPGFYERLGWERWRGPTFVRSADGPVRTEEDDDSILVLRTPTTPPLDLAGRLICDWRAGDVW